MSRKKRKGMKPGIVHVAWGQDATLGAWVRVALDGDDGERLGAMMTPGEARSLADLLYGASSGRTVIEMSHLIEDSNLGIGSGPH